MFYLLIAHVRAYQEVKNLVFRKILCTYEMNHPYVYFMLAKNLTITLKVIFKILLEKAVSFDISFLLLRGMCPNTELFLVRIFLYSDQK